MSNVRKNVDFSLVTRWANGIDQCSGRVAKTKWAPKIKLEYCMCVGHNEVKTFMKSHSIFFVPTIIPYFRLPNLVSLFLSLWQYVPQYFRYCKVASTSPSCLEAHAVYEGKIWCLFWKKPHVNTRSFTVVHFQFLGPRRPQGQNLGRSWSCSTSRVF